MENNMESGNSFLTPIIQDHSGPYSMSILSGIANNQVPMACDSTEAKSHSRKHTVGLGFRVHTQPHCLVLHIDLHQTYQQSSASLCNSYTCWACLNDMGGLQGKAQSWAARYASFSKFLKPYTPPDPKSFLCNVLIIPMYPWQLFSCGLGLRG